MGRHSLDLFEYNRFGRTVEVEELLARFPELSDQFELRPFRFSAIVSIAMGVGDWLSLNRKITEVVQSEPQIAGVIVPHGTSAIEETAYFLHLTLKVRVPVVIVGAQRPPNGLGTDAGINLLNAARVAAAPSAPGLGVLVALNDEIHSAREATKISNHKVSTFSSIDSGPLGYVDPDGVVTIYRRPTRRHTGDTEFDVATLGALPRVDIVYSHVGADGGLVDAAVALGTKAIVMAGMPPGLEPPAQLESMIRASRAGVLVVQSSRGGSGRVLPRRRELDAGVVFADNLNPQKARVLAMLALSVTSEQESMRRMFREY
jgi:L-asparaginase